MTLASQKLASELHISGSTLRATVRAHPQQHNMIQRSLLRQLRASSSRLQKPSVFSSPRLSFPAPRIPALSSRQQLYPRCYSTTAEAKASPEGETSAAEAKTSPRAETSAAEEAPSEAKEAGEDPIQKELAATKAQVIDLKDKYLRSVADFRNLQDRTKRDIQSAKDFAISRFAKDLVESIDNLDRALSTVPPEIHHPPPAPQSETPPPRPPPLTKTSSTCTKA
ncbi:MAG: molecular chaperone [Lasallia pustulata]|uniref:Molecular chaperone n=1 Tax=Lasallia pustulata TaxID=136370 RepID=A0A5M8Q0J2_9LECA|nr:MAG: molecular chaperone [Lasallia pustulata]